MIRQWLFLFAVCCCCGGRLYRIEAYYYHQNHHLRQSRLRLPWQNSSSARRGVQALFFSRNGNNNNSNKRFDPLDLFSVKVTDVVDWRTKLPPPLQQYKKCYFQRMECSIDAPFGGKTKQVNIYVLGTNHLLEDSATHVQLLCKTVQPEVIFLESCASRIVYQQQGETLPSVDGLLQTLDETAKSPFQKDVGHVYYILSHFLNTTIGGEQMAAYQYWKSQQPNEQRPLLILGDRPIEITQVRYDEATTKWDRLRRTLAKAGKLTAGALGLGWALHRHMRAVLFLAGTLVVLAPVSSVTAFDRYLFQFLKRKYEKLSRKTLYKQGPDDNNEPENNKKESLVYRQVVTHERDIYMASKLHQAVWRLLPTYSTPSFVVEEEERPWACSNVVVVVGAAHVPGLCEFFSKTLPLNRQTPERYLAPLLTSNSTEISPDVTNQCINGVLTISSEGKQDVLELFMVN